MTSTRRRRALTLLGLLLVAGGTFALVRYVVFPPDRIPRGAIVVPRDVATLDEALRHVEPGGTIVLDTHGQTVVGPFVVDTPSITICAMGSPARVAAKGSAPALTLSADGITLRNLDVAAETIGISITASRCRVEDLTVRGTSAAVRLSGAQDCTLHRIEVHGGNIGLEISSSGGIKARAVTVRGAEEAGLRVVGSWDCTLERVEVDHARVGISLEGGSRGTLLTDCALESCGESGVVLRSSNDITLARSVIRDTPVGVAVDQATDCEIRDCMIERPAVAGVVLERSLQNRLQGTTIRAPGEFGVRLSESSENALVDNDIRGGSAVAISLTASDSNLVMRNEIVDTTDGIRVDNARSCRILRNTIASRHVGIVLRGGEGARIFDNRVTGGIFGIAITSSSGNAALRNRVEGQTESAFALVGGSADNTLADNRAAQSGVGIFVAASSAGSLLDNAITGNGVGVLLFHLGSGLRVEGNRIERNLVGLRQVGSSGDLPSQLDLLDANLPTSVGEATPPILANNVFSGNRTLDVDNSAPSPLYGAGNAWGSGSNRGAAAALVSPGVSLQESAWKGTIVIGTETGDVQEILGHLVRILLARAGYHVVHLIGMGTAPRVKDAIQAGDIDLGALEPKDVEPSAAGLTTLVLPARVGWVAVVSQAVADRLPERSLSALSAMLRDAGQSVLWAIPQAFDEHAVTALRDAYELAGQVRAVVWAKTLDEAESILTFGAAEFALLEDLEENVTLSGFVSLEDNLHILPSETLAVLVRTEFLARNSDVGDALSRLAPRLTTSALRDLLSRVRLSNQSPEDAAMEFLTHEGLLAD